MLVYNTIHDAWAAMTRKCLVRGSRVTNTRELLNVMYRVRKPIPIPIRTKCTQRNKVIEDYTCKELELYQQGTLEASDMAEASSFWKKLANPDGTINSNYGYLTNRLRDAPGSWEASPASGISQWDWCIERLLADPDTRQAVMHFNRPMHQWRGNKDFPCTMYGVFHIRNGHLNYTVHMRSQDVIKGLTYDLPFFCWQQNEMCNAIDVPKGQFFGVVNSLHIYDSDVEKAEAWL